MYLVDKFKNWLRPPPAPPQDRDPFDMRQHIRDAYELLRDANKKAIQVPADVVNVITAARKAANAQLPEDLEARFWNAYGLLSSSIRPAERARTLYRTIFYVVLAVLLCGQFFFLSGDHIRSKLADLDKQIVAIHGRAAAPTATGSQPASVAAVAEQIKQIEDAQKAYILVSRHLVEFVGRLTQLPFMIFGIQNFFLADSTTDLIVRGKLEMLLVFLSGYLLPMLYGLLGACAFVLRQLSDEIDKMTYAHDARVRYSLRLNIGLLSGLAVGWFIKPGSGDVSLISLSPLALAFIAGYGSDLFFVALDKIVQAFGSPTGSISKTVREVTTGGLTTTSMRSQETHVAGPEAPAKGPSNLPDRAPTEKDQVAGPVVPAKAA